MNFLKFIFPFLITLALVVGLNNKWGQIPPLGKFLDPYHGFWANSQAEDIPFKEKLWLEGLKEEVNVYYDSILVPHVYAKNNHDLYLTQGFVTAENRLWQMEFQTHAAGGRLSEIVGIQALDFDRYQRRNGLLYGAEKAVKVMEADPTVGPLLDAYTKGINEYISSLSYKDLPLEYKLLDYKPEVWTNLKSGLLLKYIANNLTGGDSDAENTLLLKMLGKERFDFLFPDRYDQYDPVIPKSRTWDFEPLQVQRPDSISFPLVFPDDKAPQPNPQNGSNNWAVGGSRTATGKPMLANDPHLGLNLPSFWYVMHLNSPEVNVFGSTLPGALGVIIGFNDSISWGITNAARDVRDWYHIEFKNDEKKEYRYNGKWLKTQKVIQEFKIRGSENYFDTIYYTHHGPIVYDESFRPGGTRNNFALRWTAHDPSREQLTFHLLNRAKNYKEYEEALIYYDCPAQNFVYADVHGDIAMWISGKFPLRWKEQGKFIMDGSRADMDWQGFIPKEHNANAKNPEQGYLSSANQIPVDETYPYYAYDRGFEHYRNRRLNQKLASLQNITTQDMMRLQNDNFSLLAADILPSILDSLSEESMSEEEKLAFDILSNWDFISDQDAIAPTYFEVLWDELYRSLWDEFYGLKAPVRKPELPVTVDILTKHPQDEFVDIQITDEVETISDLYKQSFKSAVDSVESWKATSKENLTWSNFKNTTVQHLARIAPFSRDHIKIGGNRHILNATSARHGASWRMVVSLEEPITAYGVYPGGQSGNPGSYYYDNLIERWSNGDYYKLENKAAASDLSNIIFSQTLTPTLK